MLQRLGRNNNRMPGFVVVFGGVLVFGIIAAVYFAAGLAGPQMHPGIAKRNTFVALMFGGWFNFSLL